MTTQNPPDFDAILDALSEVADPELGVGIVPLGLIYEAHADGATLHVTLTLTSPTCPLGDVLIADVEDALTARFPGFAPAVTLTFEPAWTPERMSPAARAAMS
ncbi:metal-sulfur cluster assembly factor [Niveibacterium sp. COAC-50]|uniref:metal-sulfur cluster assembly factor n=1 Tax=Niveibacterium sp. COAC-50 TaxID=2729384 RepID=UPI00155663A1|nr:metal-sulfur cluster assembly factor [Niveibacterium sp. COAC-50]